MAFVNAVASIANEEGHLPILEVIDQASRVYYFAHAIGGLAE